MSLKKVIFAGIVVLFVASATSVSYGLEKGEKYLVIKIPVDSTKNIIFEDESGNAVTPKNVGPAHGPTLELIGKAKKCETATFFWTGEHSCGNVYLGGG